MHTDCRISKQTSKETSKETAHTCRKLDQVPVFDDGGALFQVWVVVPINIHRGAAKLEQGRVQWQ